MSITDDVKNQLKADLEELKRMRDEIKVKLHLAGKDAKDKWHELEPKLEELELKFEKGGRELGATTDKLFEDVGRAVRDFGARLFGKDGKDDGDEARSDASGGDDEREEPAATEGEGDPADKE